MARFDKENKKDAKSINVDSVVNYLNHSFSHTADQTFGSIRAGKSGTKMGQVLYRYQVQYCYLVDEIQRGPVYMRPKIISAANELIARMGQEKLENYVN